MMPSSTDRFSICKSGILASWLFIVFSSSSAPFSAYSPGMGILPVSALFISILSRSLPSFVILPEAYIGPERL